MPFGLKGAPGTFQRLMSQEVLTGYIGRFCLVYLDDIIIYSHSYEEHLRHLALVLERLKIHTLTMSVEKCDFGMTDLDYLEHRITAEGNLAQPEHFEKLTAIETSKNIKQLQSFLGLCDWLCEYVPRYSDLTAPLTDLVGKKKFQWTPLAQQAMDHLKKKLLKPLKLSRPHLNWPYVLQTDASNLGMGAVLYQITPEGDNSIIS